MMRAGEEGEGRSLRKDWVTRKVPRMLRVCEGGLVICSRVERE